MGTTSSKDGSKLEDSKFITVGTAKSPEEENQESAEVAILRKVRDLAISHPILSRPASSSSTCVTEEGRRALEQSTDGAHVQWTLETAFAALSKWYSRQASAVTRQQLSLHEEVEEVSYMSKIALQNVNKSRESLKKSAADVLGLDTVTREIDSLKQAVLRLQETSKHIAERLGGEEEDEEEDQPVKST
jgi:hypothetical protein